MKGFNHPFSFLFLTFSEQFLVSEGSLGEKKLISNLLGNYNPLSRPVTNASLPLILHFGISLMQIMEVREMENRIKTNTWQNMEWNDPQLTWNPADYDDIQDIRIPPSRIWTPDMYPYNSHSTQPIHPTHIVLKHNGSLLHVPPNIMETTCKFSFKHFPFDEQKCEIKFGSWTHDGGKVDLRLKAEGGGVTSFIPNSEWELTGMPGRRNAVYYACCPDPYVDLTYVIGIRRRWQGILGEAQGYNTIIFTTLLLTFIIHPSSPHKIHFALFHTLISFYPIWNYKQKYPHLFLSQKYGEGPMIFYFHMMGILGLVSLIPHVLTVSIYHSRTQYTGKILHLVRKLRTSKGDMLNIPGGRIPDKVVDGNKNMEYKDISGYVALMLDRIFMLIFTSAGLMLWVTLFPTNPTTK